MPLEGSRQLGVREVFVPASSALLEVRVERAEQPLVDRAAAAIEQVNSCFAAMHDGYLA
jgi:hypothetical protein